MGRSIMISVATTSFKGSRREQQFMECGAMSPFKGGVVISVNVSISVYVSELLGDRALEDQCIYVQCEPLLSLNVF